MKLRLIPADYDYLNDVQDIPRAYAPLIEIDAESENYLKWNCRYEEGFFICEAESNVFGNASTKFEISDGDVSFYKKYTKRFLKNFLYDFLSEKLNIRLPYGSLTGVRPTKLYYELSETEKNPEKYLVKEFKVSPDRAELIGECVKNQRDFINKDKNSIALFVNVPFCPTRCSYCTFISTEITRVKKEIPVYADCLIREIEIVCDIIKNKRLNVSSIYVGGGTPPSLGVDTLDKILAPLKDFGVEFTVEAGRADTIDADLINVLSRNNVTRVSVNPQTFKQATLDLIGRKHSVGNVYTAFDFVKDKFTVNMDLIAGLPNESYDDFADSLEKTIVLKPENITVHALSLKRGSVLTTGGAVKEADGSIKKMIDYARIRLHKEGYSAYYMYRQKNMADNLENVGYTLGGKQCKYNIDMMEESISVMGMGAGAMSKRLTGNRIDRLSNPKGFREYVDRIDNIVAQKKSFFEI